MPIKISASDKIRLIRQLNRENSPDCMEIIRRFLADSHDFLKIPFEYKNIENNNANIISPILYNIENYIKEKWSI